MAEKKFIKKETFTNLSRTDIYFRNFKGVNKFNKNDHRRTFAIKLSESLAESLEKKGWYVKWTKVREDAPEDMEPIPYIKVTVNFDGDRPPKVNMIQGKTVTPLDDDSIATLDAAMINKFSIEIRPYKWDDTGKYGAAAYLTQMNVWCEESVLDNELKRFMEEEDDDEDEIW